MGSQKVGHNWTTFTLFTIIFLFKLYFYLYVHASSVVSDSLWPHGLYVACQAPFSMGFSRQEYWCVLSFPPQGIFQTQGNLHLLHLLYWQWDSIPLHHLESTLFVQVITVKRKKNHGITEKDVVIVSQSLSCVWLFETPWMFACQALLSSTISWSLLKFMSIESAMLHYHLIFYCPLLLLPSQHQDLFQGINSSHQEAMYWSFSLFVWQGCDPRRGENYLRRE